MPRLAAAGDDRSTNPNHVFVSGESSMRHTRTATIATVAIALGLALTAIGMNRALPHEIGGIGSKLTVGADTWASGTAISPPLVFLVVTGLLAAITMRSTRGGARAASWLAVLTVVAIVAGLMEPVQQRIVLFQDHDLLLALTLYAVVRGVDRARGRVGHAVPRHERLPGERRSPRRSAPPRRPDRLQRRAAPAVTRQASTDKPIDRYGQSAMSSRYRTAPRFRPVSVGIASSWGYAGESGDISIVNAKIR